MSDWVKKETMSKREFIRQCALGVCGLSLAMNRWDAIAGVLGGDARLPLATGNEWMWSKEALFYTKTSAGLKCLKCPNGCVLSKGETGRCRNRVNDNGTMYSIAYGNPCAVHIDPIEKKPLFHFLPSTRAFSVATAGCNLTCLNCQNWEISQVSPKETQNYDLMPGKVVEQCLANKCESIAYTYGEPTTFYEYAFDTATIAREHGIRNVWKSNGYINEQPLRKLCKVIDAANIDLKSFDDDIYRKLNGGTLAPVLRTLKVFHEESVWLEITNLIIPTWTDNFDMLSRMYDWLAANDLAECPVHISRFTPLYKLNQLPLTPISTLEKARELAMKAGIKYVYIGNVPAHPAENTYCPKCKKLVIERRGFTILQNNVKNGICNFCGAVIRGVWI